MGIVLLSPTIKEGVINLPLIKFNFLSPTLSLSKYDYLIFTSKTAIEAINKIDPNWKKIPSLAVGIKTEKEILKFDGNPIFTGNGYGESLVPKILKEKNKNFLFIRGKEVANDLKTTLANEMSIDEVITYETLCEAPTIQLEGDLKIIFTAPSTVNCFFKNYQWKNSFTAIAIGETTKNAFTEEIEVLLPKETSIDSCIELARSL